MKRCRSGLNVSDQASCELSTVNVLSGGTGPGHGCTELSGLPTTIHANAGS